MGGGGALKGLSLQKSFSGCTIQPTEHFNLYKRKI